MLLAIDIGNSHTVIGLFANGKLTNSWRVQTDKNATADEISASIFSLFALRQCQISNVTGLIISSVVPQLKTPWLGFTNNLQLSPVFVDNTTDTGITIRLNNPSEVGADRLVNAAAGFKKYNSALIIIDFGTAITFDCVSEKAEYLGGAITPGIAIALEALGTRTAKLPRVDINVAPPPPIGTSTVSAIQSGMLYGYGGLIDGLVNRLKTSFTSTPLVLATGGMAQLIAPYSDTIEQIEPLLTLEGLQLIYDRIQGS
nr:type III pantothenate kinase [Desulfobulbaceae bacterium]